MSEQKYLVLREHRFRAIEQCPPGLFLDFADPAVSATGNPLRPLRELLYTVVVDEEHERLTALLHERNDPISFQELGAALNVLMTEYAGRPTKRPSLSPDSRESVGRRSKVVSLSQGTVRVDETSSTDGTPVAS